MLDINSSQKLYKYIKLSPNNLAVDVVYKLPLDYGVNNVTSCRKSIIECGL